MFGVVKKSTKINPEKKESGDRKIRKKSCLKFIGHRRFKDVERMKM
jgi:hypothetical protein